MINRTQEMLQEEVLDGLPPDVQIIQRRARWEGELEISHIELRSESDANFSCTIEMRRLMPKPRK